MAHLAADVVGTLAAACSITSFVPQVIKIVREKDASSVSLRTYVVTVAGFALWIVYGAMIGSWPVAGSNTLALILAGAVLALKWRYRER